MLILLTILFLAAAVSAYFFLHNRESSERVLDPAPTDVDMSHLRPLFMPTDEDLRAEEAEAKKLLEEAETEERAEAQRRSVEEFRIQLNDWRSRPSKSSIADLFDAADDNAEFFAEAAECVLDEWQSQKIAGLSATDLAQTLESRFWLIPAEKRTPGVSFRLQRLLSSLRSMSGDPSQTRDSLR